MLKKQPITEDLVRSVVGNVTTGPVEISPEKIIDAVARNTDVSREDILGKSHTKNVALARHISCFLLRKLTDMSLQQIGKFIGRHHSTVHDSVRYIEEEKKDDKSLDEKIKTVMRELGQR
jgi:chromosomal replication initiator protein